MYLFFGLFVNEKVKINFQNQTIGLNPNQVGQSHEKKYIKKTQAVVLSFDVKI